MTETVMVELPLSAATYFADNHRAYVGWDAKAHHLQVADACRKALANPAPSNGDAVRLAEKALADAIAEYEQTRGRAKGARRISAAFSANLSNAFAATPSGDGGEDELLRSILALCEVYTNEGVAKIVEKGREAILRQAAIVSMAEAGGDGLPDLHGSAPPADSSGVVDSADDARVAVIEGVIQWDIDKEEASGVDEISVRGLSGFLAQAIQKQTDIEIRHPSMGICEAGPVRMTIEPLAADSSQVAQEVAESSRGGESQCSMYAAEFNGHENGLLAAQVQLLLATLLREEADEALEALTIANAPLADGSERIALQHLARELADVVYVCFTGAWAFGIDLDAALVEIHRAAMDKVRANVRREDGKIVKPPGFVPPSMKGVVSDA